MVTTGTHQKKVLLFQVDFKNLCLRMGMQIIAFI